VPFAIADNLLLATEPFVITGSLDGSPRREAGFLLPHPDKSPLPPLCVHHVLSFLEERLGKGI
jgi:hypothetical protein